jgi:hypothetical protein
MSVFVSERLHQQSFVAVENSHGVSDAHTVFHYLIDGDNISGTYTGGAVVLGTLVGQVTGENTIKLLYQCITIEGELLAGWSEGVVQAADLGRTKLVFEWAWLHGATGGGTSCYVSCNPNS